MAAFQQGIEQHSWNCRLCTFANHPDITYCEQCNTLKDQSQMHMIENHAPTSNINTSPFNTMPPPYQIWFQKYSACKDISHIECIYIHLSAMAKKHKVRSAEFKACVARINRLVQNIKDFPSNKKYHRFRASNKAFTEHIRPINGSQLLLQLCGWRYSAPDNKYVFDSSLSLHWVQTVSSFMQFYIQQEHEAQSQRMRMVTQLPQNRIKHAPQIVAQADTSTANVHVQTTVRSQRSNTELITATHDLPSIISHLLTEFGCNKNMLEEQKTESSTHTHSIHHKHCKLNQCKAFQNICEILRCYNTHLSLDSSLRHSIYENGDRYNDVRLLNDFYHLLDAHDGDFEDIYNHLNTILYDNKGCHFTCLMRKRHYRNRLPLNHGREASLQRLYCDCDNEAIVTIQLLDRVHCYLMHTFDIGYKLTRRQQQIDVDIKHDNDPHYDEHVMRIRQVLSAKQDKQRLWLRNQSHSKFITTDHSAYPSEINCDKPKRTIQAFDYGYRFYYHARYENSSAETDRAAMFEISARHGVPNSSVGRTVSEWHIKPKYQTLRDELLLNSIATVGKNEFDLSMRKAAVHEQTNEVKQLKCTRGDSAEYYEMKTGDKITKDQIMAVMLYCNFDDLQYKFSCTFRKSSRDETDEQLKRRHSNFYWLGRRLRECVECIGMKLNTNNLGLQSNMKLYHGVNTYRTFGSITAYIKGPFSTTKCEAVAASFQDNRGLLLELNVHTAGCMMKWNEANHVINTVIGFSCAAFSDYPNEQEVLFIGGIHPIKIVDIKEVDGRSYRYYIEAIRVLTRHMSSGGLSLEALMIKKTNEDSKTIMEIAYALLSHEMHRYYPNDKKFVEFTGCPDYLTQLFHLECQNVGAMVFYSLPGYNNTVLDYYFRDHNGFIKLDVVMTVFAKVNFIGFGTFSMLIGGFQEFERLNIFERVLSVIENRQKLDKHLPEIIGILTLAMHKPNIVRSIERYALRLSGVNWQIKFRNEDDTIDQVLKRFGVDKEHLNQHSTLWKLIDGLGLLVIEISTMAV
eukprot:945277_1